MTRNTSKSMASDTVKVGLLDSYNKITEGNKQRTVYGREEQV